MGPVKIITNLQPHSPWTNLYFERAISNSGVLIRGSRHFSFVTCLWLFVFQCTKINVRIKNLEYYIIKLVLSCSIFLVTAKNSRYCFNSKRFWVNNTAILGFFPSFYYSFLFWLPFPLKLPKNFSFNKTDY